MADLSGRPSPWATAGKLFLALLVTAVLVTGLAMPAVLGSGLAGKHYADDFLNTSCNLPSDAYDAAPVPTIIYARDGKTEIARVFTQDRKKVALTAVPKYLQEALVATEDRRFYSHHGVDLRGLIRGAVNTSSGDTQGGSTLTMQLVKQTRYYQAGDNVKKQQAAIAVTLKRKMEDAQCALDIEKPKAQGGLGKSKADILDEYLNIAFFGEHAYGIQVAAQTYFHKDVSKLTLSESATLVGLLRAPSTYDPFQHPVAAKERRNEVLQNLVDVGKLSQATATKLGAPQIALATQKPPVVQEGCANATSSVPNAAFFCEYTLAWLKANQKLTDQQLQTGGLRIVTTLDPAVQKSAQANIQKAVPATSPMTAVLPVEDPGSGDILAMAASKTFGSGKGQTEQPIFTSAVADAASTYKIFPLLTALNTGMPSSLPILTTGNTGTYKPTSCVTNSKVRNGDENVQYSPTETLASATAKSSNTYFVALADQGFQCKLQPMVDLMTKLGMTNLQAPSDTANQTWAQVVVGRQRAQQLVLGSIPTSPLQMTGAYAAVANDGKFNAPAPVRSITQSDGTQVAVKRAPGVQVVSPWAAAKAQEALTGDTQSGGTSAAKFSSWYDQNSSKIAGKTGTDEANAKDNASIWFVGMTPKYTATTALINFDNPSAPSTGLPHEGKGKAYGDYAAGVWVKALKPTISSEQWTWSDSGSVAGDEVPDLTGKSISDAKKILADNGNYKLVQLDPQDQLLCASDELYGTIGYYAPHRAPVGSTITVCPSTNVAPKHYVPPKIVPPAKPTGHTSRSGHASGGNHPTPHNTGHGRSPGR